MFRTMIMSAQTVADSVTESKIKIWQASEKYIFEKQLFVSHAARQQILQITRPSNIEINKPVKGLLCKMSKPICVLQKYA